MSNARERVSGSLGRPRPGHLASLSGAHSPVSSAEACLCPRGKKGARETMGRPFTTLLPFFFLFNYCYYYWNTKREPLRRREARGTRKRNAKWLGCGRSGLALFAGSHRSPLEENSSLEPTLCQGIAVPSSSFPLGGRVRPSTPKLPSFYASILSSVTRTPIPVSDQNNSIFNILLSWICISGHFGFSSDKDDRLIVIFLDHLRPDYPKFSKKSFV